MIVYVTRPDGSRKVVDSDEPEEFAEIESINGWYSSDSGMEWFVYKGITYYAKNNRGYYSYETKEYLPSKEACDKHFSLKAFW